MDDNRDGDDDSVNVEREDHSDDVFQMVENKKNKKSTKHLTQDHLKHLTTID